jgi:hypothetical protein
VPIAISSAANVQANPLWVRSIGPSPVFGKSVTSGSFASGSAVAVTPPSVSSRVAVGEAVAVLVAELVATAVAIGVVVAVLVATLVTVFVGVFVGNAGVFVAVLVGVFVGSTGVFVVVLVGVLVGSTGVFVGVFVGVLVAGTGVFVGVLVGVLVGMTPSGRSDDSLTPSSSAAMRGSFPLFEAAETACARRDSESAALDPKSDVTSGRPSAMTASPIAALRSTSRASLPTATPAQSHVARTTEWRKLAHLRAFGQCRKLYPSSGIDAASPAVNSRAQRLPDVSWGTILFQTTD